MINSLINELVDYSKEQSLKIKVRRVYNKALKLGKLELCDKIETKYSRYFPQSDAVMAFSFALMAMKENLKRR